MKKVIAKLYTFTLRSKITDKDNRSEISFDTGARAGPWKKRASESHSWKPRAAEPEMCHFYDSSAALRYATTWTQWLWEIMMAIFRNKKIQGLINRTR